MTTTGSPWWRRRTPSLPASLTRRKLSFLQVPTLPALSQPPHLGHNAISIWSANAFISETSFVGILKWQMDIQLIDSIYIFSIPPKEPVSSSYIVLDCKVLQSTNFFYYFHFAFMMLFQLIMHAKPKRQEIFRASIIGKDCRSVVESCSNLHFDHLGKSVYYCVWRDKFG